VLRLFVLQTQVLAIPLAQAPRIASLHEDAADTWDALHGRLQIPCDGSDRSAVDVFAVATG
jgi:hypothetical protein